MENRFVYSNSTGLRPAGKTLTDFGKMYFSLGMPRNLAYMCRISALNGHDAGIRRHGIGVDRIFKSPLPTNLEAAAGAVVAIAVAAIPVAGVFAPLALTSVMVTAAALGVLYFRSRARAWPRPPRVLAALVAGLIGLSALSVVWSVDPELALAKLWRHAANLLAGIGLVAVALRVPADEADRVRGCLFYGLLAAALALIIVRGTLISVGTTFPIFEGDQYPLNPYNRGATVFAILLWPAALHAGRFGAWAVAAVLAGGGILLATYASQAALLALVVGAVAAAAIFAQRMLAALLGAGVAMVLLLMPLVPASLPEPSALHEAYHLPGSHYHRLLIWRFTADRIAERPFLGWGLEASKVIPGNTFRPDNFEAALPLHPHNAALQVWLELGAGGAALSAAICLVLGRSIQNLPRPAAAAAAGCFASAASVCLLSYGIWQSWWIAALFIAGALSALGQPVPRRMRHLHDPTPL